MKKILVINGAPKFGHSAGELNKAILGWTVDFFKDSEKYEVKVTDINAKYDLKEEADKFVWADVIVYHTSVWWFHIPWNFKKYFDEIFTEEHQKIYFSDGRRSANPTRNYGTGGLLQGKKYMLTTSWNAPLDAFTVEDEFFDQKSVDEGVMFGFHKMNQFIGMSRIDGFHFYDVMKNPDIENFEKGYKEHLKQISASL